VTTGGISDGATGVVTGAPVTFLCFFHVVHAEELTAFCGGILRANYPRFSGMGVDANLIQSGERVMRKRKLTIEEIQAYARLAKAARRLRQAQERARPNKQKPRTARADKGTDHAD
jgi:hypothetical protein